MLGFEPQRPDALSPLTHPCGQPGRVLNDDRLTAIMTIDLLFHRTERRSRCPDNDVGRSLNVSILNLATSITIVEAYDEY